MTFHPQEGPEAHADVVALRPRPTRLAAFHATELLDAAMIVLNRPRVASPFDSFKIAHLDTADRAASPLDQG